MAASVSRMVELVEWYCGTANLGYDQWNRWAFPEPGDATTPGECDCSSLVYHCAELAGFDVPKSGTRYTGTMMRDFTKAGFQWIADTSTNNWKTGDILYKDGHTAIWTGKYIAEAYGDETGGSHCGKDGDQGNETRLSPKRAGWLGYFRFPDPIAEGDHKTMQDKYIYHAEQREDGWVTIYISDYFNAVDSPMNYYGNPYTEKTLYYPEEFDFEEPPYCVIFPRATSDLINIQPYSLETDRCRFWVWNVQTNLKKRWLVPRFSVDAIVTGKLKSK